MENKLQQWRIRGNEELCGASGVTVRGVLSGILSTLNPADSRRVIPMGHGDPAAFPCFRTSPDAVDAVVDALRSASFNGYCPSVGILPARQAVAEYLSHDLPYKLAPDDVHLTTGCNHSIEVVLTVLSTPDANILLPRPGFPYYESKAAFCKLQVRHFDLLPEKGWEVDLDAAEALADENTVAMVIINPGNPCGNVYTYEHLQKVAETAKKLGILVISDEVYEHLTFGSNPFIPMGTFGSVAPVLTLGSISKRWVVPGWRLGWIAMTDPNSILKKCGVTECIKNYLETSPDPATFMQGAMPQLIDRTTDDFFSKIVDVLHKDVDICWENIKKVSCITSPCKPQGGMFTMVKLNISMLDGIEDDVDFCYKLAKEESVIILHFIFLAMVLVGVAVGLKNWLRITIAVEPALLEEGFERIKAFCQRHSKINL